MGGDHGSHGHGHGHHGPPYIIPDHTIYKVEDIPRLLAVKKRLAEKGLSDPWLRNEVWRFDRKHFPAPIHNIRIFLFRGFLMGAGLTGLTLLGTKLFYGDEGHGHGHGHEHKEH